MGPFIPTLLILVGFALRVTALGDKSLWWDEGHSVTMAGYSFPEIAAYTRQDIHVPLYFYILKLWMAIAGDSEVAIRFPSVIFSALTLAVIWKSGQKMFGAPAALAAVTIAVLSPLHLAYSQEARMYSLAALAGALTLYLIYRAVEGGQALHWISYAFAAATGLYSHYYVGLALAAQSAWAGASALVGGKRAMFRIGISALGAFALTLILYQPWWETAWRQLAGWGSTWQPPPPTSVMLSQTIAALGTGEPDVPGWPGVVAGLTLGTLVVAFITGVLDRHRRSAVLLCFLTLAAVTGGAYLAASARTFFHPRYLLPALPAFFLLTGYAVWRLSQWTRFAGVVLLGGWGLVSLYGMALYYATPKDDARAVAAFLSQEVSPLGPYAVVIVDSEQPLPYYARGDPRYTFLSVNDAGDEPLRAFVQQAIAGKAQAYYVRWRGSSYDPKGLVSYLLSVNGDQNEELEFYGYKVEIYGLLSGFRRGLLPMWRYSRPFGGIVSLEETSAGRWGGPALFRPGSKFPVALLWRKLVDGGPDLAVQVSLVDRYGRGVSGVDRPILSASLQPTSRWGAGYEEWNYYLLPIPAGLVPGSYSVSMKVYRLADQSVLGGTNIEFAEIDRTIGLKAATSLPISSRVDLPVNSEMTFLGSQLGRTEARPGETVEVQLCWQAQQRPQRDYGVALGLQSEGRWLPMTSEWPLSGMYPYGAGDRHYNYYPTREWWLMEVICRPMLAKVPVETPPGRRPITAYIYADGLFERELPIGWLQVLPVERIFAAPSPTYPFSAIFGWAGGEIELLGYDVTSEVARPGSEIELTLYWRNLKVMWYANYVAFVHLLGGDNQMYGQVDGVPGGGNRPTTSWVPGEIIAERISLPVSSEASDGQYALEVGWYDAWNGQRLPLIGQVGERSPDGLVIGTIQVRR